MKGACDLEKECQQAWNQEAERRGRGGAGGGAAGTKPGSVLWQSIPGRQVGGAGAGPPTPTGCFPSHSPGSRLGAFQSEAEMSIRAEQGALGSSSVEALYFS